MEGTVFNWSYILANSLSSCITATREGFLYWKFEFYMGSFLINSILFLNPFERLNYSWKEGKSPIFLAYQLLWTHKYHISYKLICEEFLMPLYQLILLEECKCMYDGSWDAIMEYGDYLFHEEGTKAPSLLLKYAIYYIVHKEVVRQLFLDGFGSFLF